VQIINGKQTPKKMSAVCSANPGKKMVLKSRSGNTHINALPRSGPRDRGVRLGHVLLKRVKCDRFHRDGAMLPKILRSIGIYT
jgi:hypothetical protein